MAVSMLHRAPPSASRDAAVGRICLDQLRAFVERGPRRLTQLLGAFRGQAVSVQYRFTDRGGKSRE